MNHETIDDFYFFLANDNPRIGMNSFSPKLGMRMHSGEKSSKKQKPHKEPIYISAETAGPRGLMTILDFTMDGFEPLKKVISELSESEKLQMSNVMKDLGVKIHGIPNQQQNQSNNDSSNLQN